jgi:4-hydroxy-3-methylbut-2-enyl diphosphate reductase
MVILLGKYGFCNGVDRAITIAKKESLKKGCSIYTNTILIHNKNVVNDLKKHNIYALEKGQNLNKGDTLIISAHGCGKEYIDNMVKNGIDVINAVCPFVQKIHEKVYAFSQEENTCVIIIGDKNHSEVIGIAGWCKCSQIIESFEEIDFNSADKFLVVEQTTFSESLYIKIKQKIENSLKYLQKRVEIFDSICYTTLCRQNQCESIAKESDMVLVIGDKLSSNCTKLVNLAKENCKNVQLIENEFDLKSIQIEKYIAKLGILSSASTPKELTMEVFNRMSEINNNDTLTNEEVKTAEPIVAQMEEQNVEATDVAKAEPTMEELMKKFAPKPYREGIKLKVNVISADQSGINVAIIDGCGKNDCGFIAKEEVELDGNYDFTKYATNDSLDVVIIPKTVGDKSKAVNLSKKKLDAMKLDDEHVKKILAGEEFSLKCFQAINGGLLGKIGTYTVFVPASQIRMGYVKNLEEYVDKTLRLKALPPKEELDEEGKPKRARNPKRIVASQRVILEDEKLARDEEFWSKIYEGAIVNGKVKRFADFGAFVSLKYMDALVHNSDLSWSKKRINNPGEVLEINNSYDFVVLAADRENSKISLGYKQLQPKPFEIAQEKFPVGSIITGKVARVVAFGAFVELEPGIDGLVHVSQIKHGWIQSATEVLKEGDEVTVKVMSYENDKITLSIKELLPPEEEETISMDDISTEGIDKPSKTELFNKRLEGQLDKAPKTTRRPRREREVNDEPRQYSSSNTSVTLGDLFNLKK